MDRVSELPEEMIQYILSFLLAEEAVQTSVLSKTWLRAWSTIPCLNFCDKRFCEKLFGGAWDLHWRDEQVRDKFAKFVDNTLRRHYLSIDKFVLALSIADRKLASFVDKWLGIVVAKGVKQLYLFLDTHMMSNSLVHEYTLPQTIFAANSLISLEVCGSYTIDFNLGDQQFNKCYTLKNMRLRGVEVSKSTIRRLSSIFPCIEELTLDNCFGLEEIKLSNLPNLKEFYVCSHHSLTVDITEAHSLESFTHHALLHSQQPEEYFNIFPSQSLKYLSIATSSITTTYIDYLISQCPYLEDLTLKNCDNLEWIKISSTTLKCLKLIRAESLKEVKIDAPNLIVLVYECMYSSVVSTFSLTSCSEDLESSLNITHYNLDTSSFVKWRGLQAQLRSSQMSLTITGNKISLDIEELRKVLVLDPKPQIKNLELDTHKGILTNSALLDGLFWCFCLQSLTVVCTEGNQESIKILCRELIDRRSPDCCDSNGIRCWRHYLNHVDVEYIEENEDQKIISSHQLDWKSLVDGSITFGDNTKICFTLNW